MKRSEMISKMEHWFINVDVDCDSILSFLEKQGMLPPAKRIGENSLVGKIYQGCEWESEDEL